MGLTNHHIKTAYHECLRLEPFHNKQWLKYGEEEEIGITKRIDRIKCLQYINYQAVVVAFLSTIQDREAAPPCAEAASCLLEAASCLLEAAEAWVPKTLCYHCSGHDFPLL